MAFLAGSNKPVNICEGSIRSGKTIIALVRWIIFLRKQCPDTGELVMIGRTRDAVWRNMIRPLQTPKLFGPVSAQVIGNPGASTVRMFGKTIHVLGASDVQAEKVIRGMTVCGAMVDEITTMTEDFFDQLTGRMNVDGAMLFGTTNPDSPAHWLKAKLDRVDLPDDNERLIGWTRWKFVMDDNPSLSESYKQRKKREFRGLFYKRFVLGEWVAGEGAIFDFWDPDKFVVKHSDLPKMRRLYAMGIDAGISHATSAIVLGLGVDNKLYFVNELVIKAKENQLRLSEHQQAKKIVNFLGQPLLPYEDQAAMKPKHVVVDGAAASMTEALLENGIPRSSFLPSNKQVLNGINLMSSLLVDGKLLISDKCQGLITEIPGYSWDPKKSLIGEDAPVKVGDDSIDPARYALMSTQSLWFRDMKMNR